MEVDMGNTYENDAMRDVEKRVNDLKAIVAKGRQG
jgi:hypothetical protein